MLERDERRRLERLAVRLDRRVGAGFSGSHRSSQRGRSLDFADWRDYLPGDDVRSIDVQAWARLDQVVIRLFEADVDLSAQLLLDTSGSMAGAAGDRSDAGSIGRTKFLQAQRVAAAIGIILLTRNESISLTTFDDRVAARYHSRTAAAKFLAHLERLSAAGPTPLADRANAILTRRPRRGLMVVISDFLTDEWELALGRLAARGEPVLAVCITDPADDAPDLAGEVQLLDIETAVRINVDASPEVVATFTERRAARRDALRRRVLRRGGRFIEIDAGADLFGEVTPALLKSGLFT